MPRSRSSSAALAAARSPRSDTPKAWPVPDGVGQAYVDKVHEHDLATPETAHLFGIAEPRICTPPLRELTPETSLGFSVIDFAYEILGVTLLPWQRAALIRMLELNEDGTLRFSTVVVLVARQNGKSTMAQALTIWLMVVYRWPMLLGTAQDLDVAESLWAEVADIVQDNEELAGLETHVVKTNGKKALIIDGEAEQEDGTLAAFRSTYKVKAANRRAGRGLSANLVLLDELREHQNYDAWGAITKTTQASLESLVLAISNAGDVTSVVLRYLRRMAHRVLGDPDGIGATDTKDEGPSQFDIDEIVSLLEGDEDDDLDLDDLDELDEDDELDLDDIEQDEDTLCILEWSAAPTRARTDRIGWREANPSLGYTIRFKKIASDCRTDPEWVFRTEVLCQWNDGASSGPWEPGTWEATTIPVLKDSFGRPKLDELGRQQVAEKDRIVGPVMAGIGQATGRALTYIALAGYRADGQPQVELVTGRYNTDWVAGWLTHPDRKGRIKAVTGQTKGALESTLLKQLKADRKFRLPVVEMDLIGAHSTAYEYLRKGEVWHPPHPQLDLVAGTAERKTLSAGAWVLDHAKSPVDIAPLKAWIAALWLLLNEDAEPPPPPPAPQALRSDDVDEDDSNLSLTSGLSSAGF